jgi:tetratricopeptide (TPR) repeat protein
MSNTPQCPSCSQLLDADAAICPACDATIAMPAAAAERTEIAGYRILRIIGQGGMGRVYLAEDPALGRKVAIKVITGETRSAALRARFVREARSMATVEHPHIVRIYAFGELDDNAYIVMEYVDGDMLATRIARGPLDVREALRITRQVIDALEAAWEHQIVHRDIKPSNVLLDRRNNVRVADFGLAKPLQVASVENTLTQDGYMLGSPHYVSPEQARGAAADFRADIYSAGIMLYEMLTGERPYGGTSPFTIVAKHLHEPLPDLHAKRADVAQPVVDLVAWMTAKDPQARPSSYAELLTAVDALLESPSAAKTMRTAAIPRRPRAAPNVRLLTSVAVCVVIVVAIGAALFRDRSTKTVAAPASEQTRRPTNLVIAVTPFYGPDDESAKEGRVMAALVERAVTQRLGRDVKVLGIGTTREPVQSEEAARALAKKLDAAVVIWGEAYALRGETEIQPYFTLNMPEPVTPAGSDDSSRARNIEDLAAGERRGEQFVMAAQAANQIELRKTNATGISDMALVLAGVVSLNQGRPKNALAYFEQSPKTAETMRNRALALMQLKRTDEGLAAAQEAVRLDPKNAQALVLAGDLSVDGNRWADAAAAYSAAIAVEPSIRSARGFIDRGRVYAIESFSSLTSTDGNRVDTVYLLGRDPATGRVIDRFYLPGIARSFVRRGDAIEIVYSAGNDDLRDEKLLFRAGSFDRALMPPINLLWRMRSMKAGWHLPTNFLWQSPTITWYAHPRFSPAPKPKADCPATFAALDAALRNAIDLDPTQPWHRFFLALSLDSQRRAGEANAQWNEFLHGNFAATPYMEFSWMARIAEQYGFHAVADPTYEVALAKRRAMRQPIGVHFAIEPLIEAPFVRTAARANVEGGGDIARSYQWLLRGRAMTGVGNEGEDLAAAAWAKYFDARGDKAAAARERAFIEVAHDNPLNLMKIGAQFDEAFFAVTALLIGFIALVFAVLSRNELSATRSGARMPRIATLAVITALSAGALWGLSMLSFAPSDARPRDIVLFAASVVLLFGFLRWRDRSLPSIFGGATIGERVALAAAALLLVLSLHVGQHSLQSFAAVASMPIGISDTFGHAGIIQRLDRELTQNDRPSMRYVAALANHFAGNTARARALYNSVGDAHSVENMRALATGRPPVYGLEPRALLHAYSKWPVDRAPRLEFLPNETALTVLMAIALCALAFALVLIVAPRAPRVAPREPGFLVRAVSAIVPGLRDLASGNAPRGYLTLTAFIFSLFALLIRYFAGFASPAHGLLGVTQHPNIPGMLPFPVQHATTSAAVWREQFWPMFWAFPNAVPFWSIVAIAFIGAAGSHVVMLARSRSRIAAPDKTLVCEGVAP